MGTTREGCSNTKVLRKFVFLWLKIFFWKNYVDANREESKENVVQTQNNCLCGFFIKPRTKCQLGFFRKRNDGKRSYWGSFQYPSASAENQNKSPLKPILTHFPGGFSILFPLMYLKSLFIKGGKGYIRRIIPTFHSYNLRLKILSSWQ